MGAEPMGRPSRRQRCLRECLPMYCSWCAADTALWAAIEIPSMTTLLARNAWL